MYFLAQILASLINLNILLINFFLKFFLTNILKMSVFKVRIFFVTEQLIKIKYGTGWRYGFTFNQKKIIQNQPGNKIVCKLWQPNKKNVTLKKNTCYKYFYFLG